MRNNHYPLTTLDELTPALFCHSETGKIRAGLKWSTSTDGLGIEMETYQFDTLDEVKSCATAFQLLPVMLKLSIVTHAGQYRNMRTLYKWSRS